MIGDNIQGITKLAILRSLAHRSGVKRISGLIYGETCGVISTSISISEYPLHRLKNSKISFLFDGRWLRKSSQIFSYLLSIIIGTTYCTKQFSFIIPTQ